MNVLNDNIDFRELYPFYFVIDSNFTILELGDGYKSYLNPTIGKSAYDYFSFPWEPEVRNTLEIPGNVINKRISITDNNDTLYKGTFFLTEDCKLIFLGSLWLTNTQQHSVTGLSNKEFSPVEATSDVLSLSIMMQENHFEILEQRNRLDFLSSNLNIFIATFSMQGMTEYQNNNFRVFKKSLPNNGKDFIKDIIERSKDIDENKIVFNHITEDETVYEFHLNKVNDKILIVAHDITERLQLEKVNREKEVVEEQSKFIHNFLSNMSHEIRTPLNGILGMLDVLADMELNKKQLKHLNFIKVSGESLLSIINDVLDISKIQSGKLELKPKRVNILDIVNESKRLFVSISKEKGNRIKVDLNSNVPMFVELDKLRYQQILNNLVSNANKFTVEGMILIDLRMEDGLLKTSVIDSGVGIRKEDQNKLFKEFSQVDSSYTKKNDGTGLGLALCLKLSNLMGGTAWVESEYGEGSTFQFTIKVVESNNQEKIKKEKKVIDPDVLKGQRVLLVEDKLINQKVAKLMLEKFQCVVDVAENGQVAVDMFKEDTYDFILMDIQMPVMDGMTATKTIKEMYKNVPPVIALSANAMEGDKEKYMENGMDGYISKPITQHKLITSILSFI